MAVMPLSQHGPTQGHAPILLGPDQPLTAAQVWAIAYGHADISFSDAAYEALGKGKERLAKAQDKNGLVYGLTTGFGPLAQFDVMRDSNEDVQRHLIYHLASGVGAPLTPPEARALMVVRLNCLVQGHSAPSPDLVQLMAASLNAGLAPVIPSKGTVGASGDLTPSAHMALALLGEGAWHDRTGQYRSSGQALVQAGLSPLENLHGRDGLALVNGTAAMTGIGALTIIDARRLIAHALVSAAIMAASLGARIGAYSPELSAVRPHAGQAAAAQIAEGIALSVTPVAPETDTIPQDPYSLRCLPQIFGAVMDFADHATAVTQTELISVTDNPVLTDTPPHAVHGGNFYGQHMAFAMDSLAPCLVKTAILLDRQLAMVCDGRRSRGLPPFLINGKPGRSSGLMGAQVTASALVAEMRANLGHASTGSIPTNGDNQDTNTMGTIAARQCRAIARDGLRVLAIHAIAVAQLQDQASEGIAADWVGFVRETSGFLEDDRPLGAEIEALADRFAAQPSLYPAAQVWEDSI